MILEISDFGAFTQPLCFGVPPRNGMTTGPATPFLPLWMWDAVGLPMPDQLSLKQPLPVPELRATFAVPLPSGSPFGVSAFPVIDTVSVLVAAYAETASESAATSASEINPSFFMEAILAAPWSAGPSDIGRRTP